MKFLFVAGILFFLGSILIITSNYNQLNVERNGKIVKMRIERLPKSCIGAKVRYFVKYNYEGKFYEKATRGDFCEKHYIGELIDMKLLKGSSTILRPNESVLLDLIAGAALGILGLAISILQWKKIRSLNIR